MPYGYKIDSAALPGPLLLNHHAWRGVLDGDGWSSLTQGAGGSLPSVHVGLSGASLTLHAQYKSYLDSHGLPSAIYGTGKTRDGHRQPCPETIVRAEPAARLVDLLCPGATYTIARKSDRALAVRDARLDKPGRAPLRPRVTAEEHAEWERLYAAGSSILDIKATGTRSQMTIRAHLQKVGLLAPTVPRSRLA